MNYSLITFLGYKVVKGQRLTKEDLEQLYQGLLENGINKYSYVLTGYCGNPTFLHAIATVVIDLKSINKDLIFVCDPVLGDNGVYVSFKFKKPATDIFYSMLRKNLCQYIATLFSQLQI